MGSSSAGGGALGGGDDDEDFNMVRSGLVWSGLVQSRGKEKKEGGRKAAEGKRTEDEGGREIVRVRVRVNRQACA